jgi:hypothetical protein
MAHTYIPCTQEAGGRGSQVQAHLGLRSEFKTSLDYMVWT